MWFHLFKLLGGVLAKVAMPLLSYFAGKKAAKGEKAEEVLKDVKKAKRIRNSYRKRKSSRRLYQRD